MTKLDVEKIHSQLKRWQEKLLDMSKSNPLLGLNRSRTAKLKIKSPDVFALFQKLALESSELRMPSVKRVKRIEPSNLFNQEETKEEKEVYETEEGDIEVDISAPADLKRKLRRIYDNARTTVEERGVVTLYTTFGVIRWSDDYLGDSVSPILLVPCEFVYKGPNVALRLRMTDEEIQINPSLIYYFRERHKIDLSGLQNMFEQEELNQELLRIVFKEIKNSISEQKWQVAEEAWLGTFSFQSLVLYQDLKLLTEKACSNKIVAAFAHALQETEEASEVLGDDLDSLETPEVVPVPILPTDSSQLKTLTYASRGRNLVIHGPPGTGKSQTITNIIADALGKNKKVLFVSAKMAALDIVFNRLKKEGLGQFCLEAHGVKAGKRKIIEDLRQTLESDDHNNIGPLEEGLEVLKRTRKQLNEYVIALHTSIQPLGLSVFRAIGRFAKLQNIPDVKGLLPWENVLEVSKDELNTCLGALNDVAYMSELFDSRDSHPLRGLITFNFNLQLQEQIETDLKFLLQTLKDIETELRQLKKLLPIQKFTLENLFSLMPALEAISRTTKLPENWRADDITQITTKKDFFSKASLFAKEYKEKELLYNQFSDLSFRETIELLSEINRTFKQWRNRISLSYFRWQKEVKQKLKPNIKGGFKNFQNYYEISKRLSEIGDWFKKKTPVLTEEVKQADLKAPEILEKAAVDCQTAFLLRNTLTDYDWKKSKVTFIYSEIANAADTLASLLNRYSKSINDVAERIDKLWPDGFTGKSLLSQIPIPGLKMRADEVLDNLDKLRDWILLQRDIKRCKDLGLVDFIDIKGIKASLLLQIFEKRFLRTWIYAAIGKTPCLAEFSGLKQQEIIQKFKILDERIRRLSNLRIKASAASASRQAKSSQELGPGISSEISILRFEMQKKKKIRPLRKLFSEIPHVLQVLKPCMLMSPISVSTFLKPETFHFDLVIFDEASQLPTPEAIPSILRADQVTVAGDQKQLPPTSFFEASLIWEYSEDYEEELYQTSLESLLDNCVASVPVFQEQYLKWHYRSRDERLIDFSNHCFYENRLITFPSSCTNNNGRGIRLEYVNDGIYDRGKSRKNWKEARKAAQLVIEHFKKFPDRSLGVATLNIAQCEAIQDALGEELQLHPELSPFFNPSLGEPFFIKSLENVQGDERDVIIISIGYGRDRNGVLTLNFGPLNIENGWRRWNVLVTRAKWQVILVTSLRSTEPELRRINPQNLGALALKNYIEYAEQAGILPPEPAQITEGETNDFEDSVREILVERGFIVDAQVGAGIFRIDLAIRDPRDTSRYLIGIECDGATYHSSHVARDRDLLREEILRGMGWKLHRVWSTEWFQNRDAAIKLMFSSIEGAMSRDKEESIQAASYVEKDFEFKPLPVPKTKSKYQPGASYDRYKKRAGRLALMLDENIDQLKKILVDIIEQEGPIHRDILDKRLKEVFDVTKIGPDINFNIEKAIKLAIDDGELKRDNQFIFKKRKEIDSFRVPGDGVIRPIHCISSQEIALAILYLVEDQFGIMQEQIPQAITKIFALKRTDPNENDRIREIVDELIEKKILVLNGNRVNLA